MGSNCAQNLQLSGELPAAKKKSSNFYPKSLTLLVPILELIDKRQAQFRIAKTLGIGKSLVNYYVQKAIAKGFVREEFRDRIRILSLTQPGSNFLAQYRKDESKMP